MDGLINYHISIVHYADGDGVARPRRALFKSIVIKTPLHSFDIGVIAC